MAETAFWGVVFILQTFLIWKTKKQQHNHKVMSSLLTGSVYNLFYGVIDHKKQSAALSTYAPQSAPPIISLCTVVSLLCTVVSLLCTVAGRGHLSPTVNS